MDLTLSTPGLLFPAISLLLLAYTNRFLAIATLIRGLHSEYEKNPHSLILKQIESLRKRVYLIRNMQAMGVLSFFLCVFCMFLIFESHHRLAEIVFDGSLFFLMVSLLFSLYEIQISVDALNVHLNSCKDSDNGNK